MAKNETVVTEETALATPEKIVKKRKPRTVNPNANKSYSISLPPLRFEAIKEYASQRNASVAEIILELVVADATITAIFESKLEAYLAEQIEALKASIRGGK